MASFAGGAASLLLAVFFLLAASASARPGVPFHPFNAHIITYTISTTGDHHVSRSVSILRIITPARTIDADPHYAMIRRPESLSSSREVARPDPAAFGFSSLRERAKDILVVVIGLLFGVGCGALTGATMYLVWSLVTYRHEICGSDAYRDEEEEVDESPKKAGYAKIPATDIAVKEGYIHPGTLHCRPGKCVVLCTVDLVNLEYAEIQNTQPWISIGEFCVAISSDAVVLVEPRFK